MIRGAYWSLALRCAVPAFAVVGSASAVQFDVNSPIDERDANLGDGVCLTANGVCSLRAAVEQANELPGLDHVFVPAGNHQLSVTTPAFPCTLGSRPRIEILDDTEILGEGATTTIIDGAGTTGVMSVASIEAFAVDDANGRVLAYRQDGQFAETFIAPGNGLEGMTGLWETGFAPGSVLVGTWDNGLLEYSAVDGSFVGVRIPSVVEGQPFAVGDITQSPTSFEFLVYNLVGAGGIWRYQTTTQTLVPYTMYPGIISMEAVCLSGSPARVLGAITVEDRIAAFDDSGAFIGDFAFAIPQPLKIQDHVATGMIYVSTGTDAVYRFGVDGTNYGELVPPGGYGLTNAFDLEIGPNGDLFVHSAGTGEILRIDPFSGELRGRFEATGPFMFHRGRSNGPFVAIDHLTLANGQDDLGGGAGIDIDRGAFVVMEDVIVRNNVSETWGGGISNGGTLFLSRAAVIDNSLPPASGGATSTGGGIYNQGQLFVTDALIARNFGGKGGGVTGNGAGSRTDLVNTTIHENRSDSSGGGVRVNVGSLNINFCTITNNQTHQGGDDADPYGGGVFAEAGGIISIGNSIVAQNSDDDPGGTDTTFAPDCYTMTGGEIHSFTDNVIGALTADCHIFEGGTTLPPADLSAGTIPSPLVPELLDLGEYGGISESRPPSEGSALIDGDATVASLELFQCQSNDQRGIARPEDGDVDGESRCDIGAVEVIATLQDFDLDGIDDDVDFAPASYSNQFGDEGSTHGSIESNGGQFITVSDAASPGEGVTITTSVAGTESPAFISLCGDEVFIELGPGESGTFTCVTANAGMDLQLECNGNGKATGALTGSGTSLSGGALSYSWSVPGVALQNAQTATANGSFPLGTHVATLTAMRGIDFATDTATVTVRDTTKPVLTVPSDVYAASCTSVNVGQATALDACGAGPVTITKNAPSSYKAGVYTITWTATDAAGNQTTRTQRVTVGLGDNQSCCPVGSNVIVGTSNNDTLTGTSGVDCILGKGAQDTIRGLGGNDILSGGEGNDVLEGGDGEDVVEAGAGQDTLRGQNGGDWLSAGGGDDFCYGGSQDDAIHGGAGQDRLYGENGNDLLLGEDGDDRLEGAAGDDTLNGGAFNDTCLGGSGANALISCEF